MSQPHRISDKPPMQQESHPAQENNELILAKRAQQFLYARKYLMSLASPNADPQAYDFLMNLMLAHTIRVIDITLPSDASIVQIADKQDFITTWLAFGSQIYKQEKINPQSKMKEWWSYLIDPETDQVSVIVESSQNFAPQQRR